MCLIFFVFWLFRSAKYVDGLESIDIKWLWEAFPIDVIIIRNFAWFFFTTLATIDKATVVNSYLAFYSGITEAIDILAELVQLVLSSKCISPNPCFIWKECKKFVN